MTTATDAWLRLELRTLPRRVSPIQRETLASYIRRLAWANHLHGLDLVEHLLRDGTGSFERGWLIEQLAIVSGHSTIALCYALPELKSEKPTIRRSSLLGREASRVGQSRAACRLCMAAKGITDVVEQWVCHHTNVCLRHRLWIGEGAYLPSDQLPVHPVATVIAAQEKHHRLISRHGWSAIRAAFVDARSIRAHWDRIGRYQTSLLAPGRTALRREIANYPQVVTLAGLLASPHWRQFALSSEATDHDLFHREITRRVTPDYNHGYPRTPADPIQAWFTQQQQRAEHGPRAGSTPPVTHLDLIGKGRVSGNFIRRPTTSKKLPVGGYGWK
jgi:hypothetical protein